MLHRNLPQSLGHFIVWKSESNPALKSLKLKMRKNIKSEVKLTALIVTISYFQKFTKESLLCRYPLRYAWCSK